MRPKFPETAFPLAPSHTVLLRAPPSCFNMTLHAAIDGQRHGIQQVGFSPRGARPPLLGCLQFASGGSAPGNILAGPPARHHMVMPVTANTTGKTPVRNTTN